MPAASAGGRAFLPGGSAFLPGGLGLCRRLSWAFLQHGDEGFLLGSAFLTGRRGFLLVLRKTGLFPGTAGDRGLIGVFPAVIYQGAFQPGCASGKQDGHQQQGQPQHY